MGGVLAGKRGSLRDPAESVTGGPPPRATPSRHPRAHRPMLVLRHGKLRTAFATSIISLALGDVQLAHATVYTLTNKDDEVFGEDQTVTTVYEDTLYDLAAKYSLGSEEIIRVNPWIDPWIPGAGKQVIIPAGISCRPVRTRASS